MNDPCPVCSEGEEEQLIIRYGETPGEFFADGAFLDWRGAYSPDDDKWISR